jgi:hypothetical protein
MQGSAAAAMHVGLLCRGLNIGLEQQRSLLLVFGRLD